MDLSFINIDINNRYITLEGTIKSKNNSFYDAYLDLLESTIKYFLDENEIPYDKTKTCGHIVKNEEAVKVFLLDVLMFDEHTYSKLPDYIKKCNDHKHKKEKSLQLESVLNYLKIYFNIINYYLNYKKLDNINFDSQYYISIYNEVEKINVEYKIQYSELSERTEAIENKIDSLLNIINSNESKEVEYNRKLDTENYLKISSKFHIWLGNENEFHLAKKGIYLLFTILVIIGIISSILSTKTLNLYSTYTFFENIWLFLSLLIILKILKLKRKMLDTDLKNNSLEIYEMNKLYYWQRTYKEKKRYKWFRRISYVCCFLNIFMCYFPTSNSYSLPATIFEILFFAISLTFAILVSKFYDHYGFLVLFDERKHFNKSIVYLHNIKFISMEEANNIYKDFF